MGNSVVLRIASAGVFALMAGSVTTSPATAFVGLSDKQADEISEFIKCKTYLLTGDLLSFEDDPDCGGGPNATHEMGSTTSDGSPVRRDNCYPPTIITYTTQGGEYCYPTEQ